MAMSIRELVNIQISISAFYSKPSQIAKILANVAIDINSNSIQTPSAKQTFEVFQSL